MSKVLLVGVQTREKGGQSRGGQTKIRFATIISLKAISRKVLRNERRKIRVMMGLGTELVKSMLVT